jgi:hypothetical protein
MDNGPEERRSGDAADQDSTRFQDAMQLCQGNLWIGQMLDDMGCEDNVKRIIRVGQTDKTGAPDFEFCLRMLKARLRLLEHSLGYVDRIHVKGARKLLA